MRCRFCGNPLQEKIPHCAVCGGQFDPDNSSTYLAEPFNGLDVLFFTAISATVTSAWLFAWGDVLRGIFVLIFLGMRLWFDAPPLVRKRKWVIHSVSLYIGYGIGVLLFLFVGLVIVSLLILP
jgi:hypothetical protein